MGSPEGMLDECRKSLGLGEPNYIQDWYNENVEDLGDWNWAWCDAGVTYWAAKSGNMDAVCPRGGRAYTPWHADDFRDLDRWYPGTSANVRKAKPGDIVFFDWGGSNSIGRIDHVGVVERNLGGGRVQTIEGNTSNSCRRRVRTASTIAGFGRPDYSGTGSGKNTGGSSSGNIPGMLDRGDSGSAVRDLQKDLNSLGADLVVDGDFGPKTEKAVKAFQKDRGLEVDGIVGPKTKAALKAALGGSESRPGSNAPTFPGRLLTQPPMMSGRDVRKWQRRMHDRGWRLSVDGWYGPRSEEVCRAFQAEKGLVVDGIVGPNTWRASWEAPITP